MYFLNRHRLVNGRTSQALCILFIKGFVEELLLATRRLSLSHSKRGFFASILPLPLSPRVCNCLCLSVDITLMCFSVLLPGRPTYSFFRPTGSKRKQRM